MKKGTAITIISILAAVAIVFGILYITNDSNKTKQIDTLKAELSDKASQIDNLNDNLTDKAGQIETLNANISDKAGQIESLTNDVTGKAEEINTLNTTIQEKDSQIEFLNADITDKAEQIESLNADISDKAGQIESLNKDVAGKAEEITALNTSVQEKDSRIESLNADITDKAGQIESLNNEVAGKTEEINTLNTTIQEKDNQIKSLNETITEKTAQIDSLNENVASQASRIESLNADISFKSGQIETQATDIADKAAKIEALNAEITKKTAEIESLNATIAQDKEQLEALTTSGEEKSKQIETLQADISDKNKQIEELQSVVSVKDNQVDLLKEMVSGSNASNTIETDNNALIAPTEEFIIARLKGVPHIAKIAAATEDNDPNGQLGKQGGYTAQIYFSSTLVDPSYASNTDIDIIKEGTSCGGSIEVYVSAEDAERRNKYLASFDGGALSSGSHTVIGTVLIRTSHKLSASDQKKLEEEIIAALNSDESKKEDAPAKNPDETSNAAQTPDGMKAYECSGIPYYVWDNWEGPVVNDRFTYYYKDRIVPLSGMLMAAESDFDGQTLNDSQIEEELNAVAQSMGTGLGSEVKTEPLNFNSRRGLYLSGSVASNGGYTLVGYITFKNSKFVALILVDNTSSESALRSMLMEIINQ